MSILVKGIDMPFCCVVCPFKEMYNDGLLCKATNPHLYIPKLLHKRNEKCPLVEVPTPHGDLIDRSELLREVQMLDLETGYDVQKVEDMVVEDCPTIIKAEE